MQWLQYSSELLTFSRVWIDFPQSVHDAYVVGPHLLFEAIKLGDKSIELLRFVFLLSLVDLFMDFADFAVGSQLARRSATELGV